MKIGDAIEHMQRGGCVHRRGWNGKGQYLGIQKPDAHIANTLPYVYIVTVQGDRVPWIASQIDLLADDWDVTYENNSTAMRGFNEELHR